MNERKTSPLAIVSLIAGILGWTLLPFLGSIGAIITGHMARAEIRRSSGSLDGDGMAIAGLILGWLQVVITVLGVLFVFLFLGGLAWFASMAS
jgi:small-conductance mechanosensitive channel